MFRLFGFDVRVQAGFLIFLGLIAFLYPRPLAFWIAGALAGFTLLHELGHAVAARSAGAEASISLSFMAGYTSFRPSPMRPISRGRRAIISAAGPLVQIIVGVAVLLALGANPLQRPTAAASDAAIAVWWAGPMIGLLNLIPVLPLDGGHLLETAVQPIFGKRTLRVVAIFSIVATIAVAVWLAVTGNSNFSLFVAFLILGQAQILQSTSDHATAKAHQPVDRAAMAETSAWQTGRPGLLEPGQVLSPWFRSYLALQQGNSTAAAQPIINDVTSSKTGNWAPPTAATPQQLARITAVLPDPLPVGNARSEAVLGQVLLTAGEVPRAGRYAVGTFQRHGGSASAMVVARAAATMGDVDVAGQWIVTGIEVSRSEPSVAQQDFLLTLQRAPELAPVRSLDPVQRALAALTAP